MFFIRDRGIAFKLALLILSATLLTLTVIMKHNYEKRKPVMLDMVKDNARHISEAALNKLKTELVGVQKVPHLAAYTLERHVYTEDGVLDLLHALLENNPEIYTIGVAYEPFVFDTRRKFFAPHYFRGKNGIELIYRGEGEAPYFERDWYKVPREKGKATWTEPYASELMDGSFRAAYSVPLYTRTLGGKQFAGVVTAHISIDELQKIIAPIKIARTGFAFLLSSKGLILNAPDEAVIRHSIFEMSRTSGDPDLKNVGEVMVMGKSGFIQSNSLLSGRKTWLFYAPLEMTNWSLGVVFPEDELLEDLEYLSRTNLLFVVSGLIILLVVIVMIARSITRPLGELATAADEIAKGNLEHHLPIYRSQDEMGQLTRSFSSMQQSLKEYLEEIKDLSKFPEENPNPVLRVKPNGEVLYANHHAEELVESMPDRTVQRVPAELLTTVQLANRTGTSQVLELAHDHRIFSFEVMPVEGEGYLNLYGKDITSRRETEEELNSIRVEKERFQGELELATRVQEGFLPQQPPDFPGYEFAAKTYPAKFVGGDFYDFVPLDEDKIAMVIGDVSGKGVSASLYMARLLSDFRYVSLMDPTPAAVMTMVNSITYERTQNGMFATAVFLLLNLTARTLTVANAGHHPLLVRDASRKVREQGAASGVPLGIFRDSVYSSEEIELHAGDLVCLYTDGALEPMNGDKEQFGLDRFVDLITGVEGGPAELIRKFHDRIHAFSHNGSPHDDMTFMLFELLSRP